MHKSGRDLSARDAVCEMGSWCMCYKQCGCLHIRNSDWYTHFIIVFCPYVNAYIFKIVTGIHILLMFSAHL